MREWVIRAKIQYFLLCILSMPLYTSHLLQHSTNSGKQWTGNKKHCTISIKSLKTVAITLKKLANKSTTITGFGNDAKMIQHDYQALQSLSKTSKGLKETKR